MKMHNPYLFFFTFHIWRQEKFGDNRTYLFIPIYHSSVASDWCTRSFGGQNKELFLSLCAVPPWLRIVRWNLFRQSPSMGRKWPSPSILIKQWIWSLPCYFLQLPLMEVLHTFFTLKLFSPSNNTHSLALYPSLASSDEFLLFPLCPIRC